jgi:CRP-like cAMP-binding protein
VTFQPDQVLMTEGEPGDRYILIASGAVEVTVDGEHVRECGPGNGIGEIALLRHGPRTATATATTPVKAYEIGTDAFLEAVSAPFSWAAAVSVAAHRLGELMLIPRRAARS